MSDKIRELLNRIVPRLDAGGPNPIDPELHPCEWALYQERERIHAEFEDALAQQPATAVPDGYRLVPVEPDPEMTRAIAVNTLGNASVHALKCAYSGYRAMLAAAPAAPDTVAVPRELLERIDDMAICDGITYQIYADQFDELRALLAGGEE